MEVTIRHRYNLNVELKLKASKRFIFFTYTFFKQIVLHMNTKIHLGLLTMGRNWYPWKFQILKKKIEVVNQKLGHPFNTHFRVIVCIIRMVFNKTVFQMTVDKVSKST